MRALSADARCSSPSVQHRIRLITGAGWQVKFRSDLCLGGGHWSGIWHVHRGCSPKQLSNHLSTITEVPESGIHCSEGTEEVSLQWHPFKKPLPPERSLALGNNLTPYWMVRWQVTEKKTLQMEDRMRRYRKVPRARRRKGMLDTTPPPWPCRGLCPACVVISPTKICNYDVPYKSPRYLLTLLLACTLLPITWMIKKKNQQRLPKKGSKAAERLAVYPSSFSIFHLLSTHNLHTLQLRTQWVPSLHYFQPDGKTAKPITFTMNWERRLAFYLWAVLFRTLPYRGPGLPKTFITRPCEGEDGRSGGEHREGRFASSTLQPQPCFALSSMKASPQNSIWRTISPALRSAQERPGGHKHEQVEIITEG